MRLTPRIGFAALLLLSAGTALGAEPRHRTHRPIPHKQVGKASIYSTRLQGRHMTDGERLNVASDAAASKTLPLGTKAEVTNLRTGKTAEVTIKDRGPVPAGRVVDLTPHTAQKIGLTKHEGLAPVVVVPTSVPPAKVDTVASRP